MSLQGRHFSILWIAVAVCLQILALALLTGCAKKGVVLKPLPESLEDLHDSEGFASWYGPGFHGRRTASGEKYDQRKLTAAHRTLPFGTLVRVKNIENDKSVVVRINDRGPFVGGRVIDLSKSAARAIGFIRGGTAQVKLNILTEEMLLDEVREDIKSSIKGVFSVMHAVFPPSSPISFNFLVLENNNSTM